MSDPMPITFINTLDDSRWLRFIHSHPDASLFHHPAWARLFVECYGYRAFAAVVTDTAGDIVGGLPLAEVASRLTGRRWVAFPFTDTCQPLVTDDDALRRLADGLRGLHTARQAPSMEIHWPLPGMGAAATPATVVHALSLAPGADQLFRAYKKTQVGRGIAKAQREGVVVATAQSRADMDEFYALHCQTRRRHGAPIQPKRYFDLLWARLLAPGLGFLLLARQDGQTIAGAVFLAWNRTLIYKYGASDPAHWGLRPNNALFWNAIQWGCANGYTRLDFGKSDASNQGLRDFKSSWGAEEQPLSYSQLGGTPRADSPGIRDRVLGPFLRNSPPIVARAVGELLYGHFG